MVNEGSGNIAGVDGRSGGGVGERIATALGAVGVVQATSQLANQRFMMTWTLSQPIGSRVQLPGSTCDQWQVWSPSDFAPHWRRVKPPAWLVAVLVAALLGLVFAALSTYDFVQHLDRQLHGVHCSFIPGLGKDTGETGCQAAMMSPYSSILRTRVWGGVPISLPAMSVFAFLVLASVDVLLTRRTRDRRVTGFLALATALPAAMSIIMLIISLTKLGTTCKLCVAIYVASTIGVIAALIGWRRAAASEQPATELRPPRPGSRPGEPAFVRGAAVEAEPTPERRSRDSMTATIGSPSYAKLAGAFAVGVAFVAIPTALYLALAPDHDRFIATCDTLAKPADTYNVMVKPDQSRGAVPVIELLDPLCPTCRAFEHRLASSGLADRIERKAILFPLDNSCNWMVSEATHPGACAISEAVLCAGDRAPAVIEWAFEQQDHITAAAKVDPAAAHRMVKERFPDLASCVGSAEVRAKLNKSLRWAVNNNLRVLTPQLFIGGVKLCDEDIDLGLEYTLSRMLDRYSQGTLTPRKP